MKRLRTIPNLDGASEIPGSADGTSPESSGRHWRPLLILLVHVAALLGVHFLAGFASGHLGRIEGLGREISAGHLGLSGFFISLTLTFIWLVRTRDFALDSLAANVVGVMGGISAAAMLTALAAFLGLFGAVEGYDPRSTIVMWLLALVLLPSSELLVHGGIFLLRRVRGGHEISVIVVGGPEAVPPAVSQFRSNGHSFHIVGLVSPEGAASNGVSGNGVPNLGGLESLPQILKGHTNGHRWLVAIPNSAYSRVKPLFGAEPAGTSNVRLAVFPANGSNGAAAGRAAPPRVFPWAYESVKRALDLAIAFASLAIASPLMGLIALLIKLESRGPVLYSQVRVGRNGQLFKMHKFRSMRKDADKMLQDLMVQNEAKGPMFKMARDPRITRVGAVIRRLSLDELPQLFDVVAGTMSIVGPRPPLPHEVEQYEPRHFRRFEGVPGITGLWQVKRGPEINFDEMVALDTEYLDRWSLGMDLSIIARTVPAMLKGQGAM